MITDLSTRPNILILEDDPDQMELLISFVRSEITKLIDHGDLNDVQRNKLRTTGIIKISNIDSLEKAAVKYQGVVLAILDCNTPDVFGGSAHDQLIKTKYKITGQHKSVDIIVENLPDTPITIISSLNRFKRIVSQYYEKTHDLNINFIGKDDQLTIERNIETYLRQYLNTLS